MSNLLKSFTNSVKYWYIPLILGIVLLLFGIYIFTVPLETYLTLSVLFSISFVTSGVFEIFFSFQNSKSLNGWGWYLVSGILSLAIGIYLLINPGISVVILPFVVGFAIMFRSFYLLGISFDLKDAGVMNWGNLAITSILGIILSFLLISNPLFSGISIVTLTALSFIFLGISSIVLSFDLKKVKDFPKKLNQDIKQKIAALQNELKNELKK
ncbi:HdeD family acid-resistance protein [Chryseobacterium sp. T1]